MATPDSKTKGPPRLSLGDAGATRRTIARLIRLRFRGELDTSIFRDLMYGCGVALGYDKLLADLRLDERLDALEAALAARNQP